MAIPDEVRLLVEGAGIIGSAAVILYKLGRLGERFDGHATTLKAQGMAIDKIEEAMSTLAVQKDQIASIREMQALNTKRTDETFGRVFQLLDRIQEKR